jgi:hypothetical protein
VFNGFGKIEIYLECKNKRLGLGLEDVAHYISAIAQSSTTQ